MKSRPFEIGLLLAFGLLALLAVALLSGYRPSGGPEEFSLGGPVVIWGTVSADAVNNTLSPYVESNDAYRAISYVQKNPNTFDEELLNALAEDRGPDILLLSHEELVDKRNKIQPIPYDNFPLRDFRSNYIEGAEIFLMQDGVYAYPLAVDPLMMYWNRDIMTSKNVLQPPKTWEELVNTTVPTFVERDYNRTINLSPVAFGEYRNVGHAFDVLSLLLIQGGSNLVSERSIGNYLLLLNQNEGGTRPPLEAALAFYTSFAQPSSPLYSWNRSLPLDQDEFVANDLVLYFAKGSEARDIAARNPNLNIDIAEVPQGASASLRRTYGTFYGWSILRNARNKAGAYKALQLIGSENFSSQLALELGMAPVHRNALLKGSDDVYGRIIFGSAVVARGWLNPNRDAVDTIFTTMVEDVLANRAQPSQATNDALGRLELQY